MKALLVAFCLVAVVFGRSQLDEKALFANFVQQYNKVYSAEEFQTRFEIFKQNLAQINFYNNLHTSATFGVTKFADLTREEFAKYYLNSKPFVRDSSWPVAAEFSDEQLKALPDSFDWRDKGAVTPVKNQGQCGSCWAFSTVGNLEGQHFLAGNSLIGLSEQNLVDCDHHCMQYQGQSVCDQGCEGGLMPNAFQYVIGNGGIDTEASYPYQGIDNTCAFSPSNVGAQVSNWTMVSSDETQMAAFLVQNGPVSVAVDATEWQFYIGGLFDFYYCGSSLDHGVLLVGYGHQDNFLGEDTPYWLIKNSWGGDWGESGYIKLERGESLCGVNAFPCSALH